MWKSHKSIAVWKLREVPWRKQTQLTPWLWTSSLENCEKIKFCGLSHPISGIWLWQPYWTNTNWYGREGTNTELICWNEFQMIPPITPQSISPHFKTPSSFSSSFHCSQSPSRCYHSGPSDLTSTEIWGETPPNSWTLGILWGLSGFSICPLPNLSLSSVDTNNEPLRGHGNLKNMSNN